MKLPINLLINRHNLYILLFITTTFFVQNSYGQQLAFPSAKGSGAYVTGGRGGIVVHVTNLNDSGPGSFRAAMSLQVPRTVVFDVSGVITLNSILSLGSSNSNVTIAGQTAPEGGITIEGHRLFLSSVSNIICRHIRFKGGATINNDSVSVVADIQNQIFDHCSFAFGSDECASWYSTFDGAEINNVTIQRCLFGESSKGSIIGKQSGTTGNPPTVSFIFNMFYNSNYRFPNITGDNGRLDVINNIAWNAGNRLIRGNGSFNLNHIGNYCDYGSTGVRDVRLNLFRFGTIPQIYSVDNKIVGNPASDLSNEISEINTNNSLSWKFFQDGGGFSYGDQLPSNYFTSSRFTLLGEPFDILTADDAFSDVVSDVGCNARLNSDGSFSDNKDILDADWISQVEQGNFVEQLNTSEYVVPEIISITRPSEFYQSNPHIPENWFNSFVPNGQDHNDISPNGYTWLEEYLNQVDEPAVVINAENVTLTPEAVTLNVPESIILNKIFTPVNTTDKSGLWESSDPSIAVVDSNGLVTSISEGITTISFISNDGGFIAESQITVTDIQIPLESVTVSPNSITLEAGEDIQLLMELLPSNTSDILGNWSSNNELVAQVDQMGLVTSISEGIATITYTADDSGISDSASITVIDTFYGSYDLYNAETDVLIQNINGDSVINLENQGNQINFRCIPSGGDSNPDVESVRVTWSGPTSGTWIESVPLYAGLPGGHVDLDFEPYTVEDGTYNFTIEYFSENSASGNLVGLDTFSLTFFFSNLPNANAGPDQDICEGETITLTASGGENFLWDSGETTASITVSPSVSTTYAVTVSDNDGNSDEDSVTVTVNTIPIADAGEDQTICEGQSITLTANGGNSYLWSTGETTQSIDVNPISDTLYNVEVFSNSCSSLDSITVFVNDAPDITLSNNTTIVEGDSIVLVASGGDNYAWSNGESSSSIEVSPSQTTTYSVSSAGNNGCSTTLEVVVSVEALYEAFAGEDERVCENNEIEVTLTANNGDSYLWNTGETTQSILVNPLSTTTYSVTVNSGIQVDTDEVTIFVDPNPNVIIANGENVDILNGDFVTLSASGANTYLWNNGATQPNIAVSPTQTTTYDVSGFIGECNDNKQVTVNVIPEVIADAGEDVEVCLGQTIALTASGGDQYAWSTGETTQTINVTPTQTTEYTVTVFNALDFDEDSVLVEVLIDCEEDDNPSSSDDPLDFSFDVFPNPANTYVDVKLSGSVNLTRVYLYDITGKLIHYKMVVNENLSTSSTTRLDVSNLQPGMYYIKMVDINNEISKKLIVR
ncbi:Ig-like domain-containing protein [Winogradskyella sp. PE311]|uniref:Ig-like domain-containing protein n=1 Tax=Winogradskyella sp. PE311 TaxID=3366943 RepID=UPI00397ECB9E